MMNVYIIYVYKGETSPHKIAKAFFSEEKAKKWAENNINILNTRYYIECISVES